MRIGVESDILHGPMTGIGNYCFHLLRRLLALEELDVWGFTGLSWQKLDPELFAALEIAHRKSRAPTERLSSRARATAATRSMLQNTEIARQLYRTIRAQRFRRLAPNASLSLFHAFRYLPPAELTAPVLPVVYDLSFERYAYFHPADRRRQLSGLPEIISSAQLVQTISEFSKREIVSLYGYPPDKVFVAPPAPAEIFAPLGRVVTSSGLSSQSLQYKRYFLSVGTLEPRKNLRTLIKAYSNLPPSQRSRFPLVIVGNPGWGELALPPETDHLVQRTELRFLSQTPDPLLRHLYEGATALVFPSIYEGFGMPVVEALACGTRVAHSCDSAMDEVTQGMAIRVPALDVDGWTEALRYYMANPEETSFEAKERIARAQQFSWEASATSVRDAYRQISAST